LARIYAIADVHGRFDVLIRVMEAISADAREHRQGPGPEHKVVIFDNALRGRDRNEIAGYLNIERHRGGAPIIQEDLPAFRFSADSGPGRVVIGIFDDRDLSGGPIALMDVGI